MTAKLACTDPSQLLFPCSHWLLGDDFNALFLDNVHAVEHTCNNHCNNTLLTIITLQTMSVCYIMVA